jgi:hypothetical protein
LFLKLGETAVRFAYRANTGFNPIDHALQRVELICETLKNSRCVIFYSERRPDLAGRQHV